MKLSSLKSKIQRFSHKKKFGPIAIELRLYSLNMVQLIHDGITPGMYIAVTLPLNQSRDDLLLDPGLLKAIIRKALKTYPFVGKQCVSVMPANQMKFKFVNYQHKKDLEDSHSLYLALQDLFGKQLESSVVDYIAIRPENKVQSNRSAIVAMAKRDDVNNYLDMLTSCGLSVDALEIGPIAIRRLISNMSSQDEHRKLLIVNFGTRKSYFTVLWGRRILLDRKVDFGHDLIVNSVAKELNTSFEQASALLEKYGLLTDGYGISTEDYADRELSKTLNEIVTPLFTKFSSEIRDVLLYTASETHGGAIETLYLMGSIAHWHGVDDIFNRILSVTTQTINPFYSLNLEYKKVGSENHNDLSGIAVATGLALRNFIDDV